MQVLIAVNTPEDDAAGFFAGERHAGASTPAARAFLEHARARLNPNRPVVHSDDAHQGGEREIVPPKRHDGALDGTSSGEAFRRRGVVSAVPVGRHTRGRVRATAYGAVVRGLRVAMPEGTLCVLDGVDRATALDDPRRRHGATVTTGAGANRAEAAQ